MCAHSAHEPTADAGRARGAQDPGLDARRTAGPAARSTAPGTQRGEPVLARRGLGVRDRARHAVRPPQRFPAQPPADGRARGSQRRWMAAASLPRPAPHNLIVDLGLDVAQVSRILGHARITITLDIYTHLFEDARHAHDIRTRMAVSPFARLLETTASPRTARLSRFDSFLACRPMLATPRYPPRGTEDRTAPASPRSDSTSGPITSVLALLPTFRGPASRPSAHRGGRVGREGGADQSSDRTPAPRPERARGERRPRRPLAVRSEHLAEGRTGARSSAGLEVTYFGRCAARGTH